MPFIQRKSVSKCHKICSKENFACAWLCNFSEEVIVYSRFLNWASIALRLHCWWIDKLYDHLYNQMTTKLQIWTPILISFLVFQQSNLSWELLTLCRIIHNKIPNNSQKDIKAMGKFLYFLKYNYISLISFRRIICVYFTNREWNIHFLSHKKT